MKVSAITESAKYRLLVDTSNEGIFIIDTEDTITFCNDRLSSMLKLPKEQIIGQKRLSFIWKEDRADVAQRTSSRRQGLRETYECRLITSPDAYLWCLTSASPIYDAKHNFMGSFGMMTDISQIKETQKAFISSEKRFRLLTENSLDIISLHTSSGICTFISPVCTRVLGYKIDEVLGKNFLEFIHPDDIAKTKQAYSINYSRPINISITFRIRKKDGRYIWCETTSKVIPAENGEKFEIQSSTRDISARKTIENKLYDSLSNFSAVIENTNDMIWIISAQNYTIKSFNSSFSEFLLNEYGIILKQRMKIDEFLPSAWVDNWYEFYKRSLLSGPFKIEYALEESGGVIEFLFHPIVSQGNNIDVLVSGRNITERINAKKELEKSEQKYRLLFENMTAGFGLFEVLLDNDYKPFDFRFVEYNSAFKNLFLHQHESIVGKTVLEVNPAFDRDIIKRIGDIALTDTTVVVNQYMPELNKHFDVLAFKHAECMVAVIASDVTVRKNNELELETYRYRLEDLIKERTKELEEVNRLLHSEIEKVKTAEEKVLSALEHEKELNEMKTRFISMTSHEFRTPLTAILSSADLLELYGKKWSDEKNRKHTGQIRRSVKYMTELLEDVLAMGRVETGKVTFSPGITSIYDLCVENLENIKNKIKDTHTLEFNFHSGRKEYCVDEKLMTQILSNIVNNSIKYSPAGGHISINVDEKEGCLVFIIKDQGIGIPQTELAKITTPFYRGRNVSNIPGTGLGLAIVKNAIELHGGKLLIESEVDKGSVFTVIIPIQNGI